MASCIFTRLCSLNTTTTAFGGKYASNLIYVASEAKIFVAWVENGSVRFAKYDPATRTPSAEVSVYSYTPQTGIGTIRLLRLNDASNTLVIVWYADTSGGALAETCAIESTDGGATWGSRNAFSGQNELLVGAYDNGTNVVACVVGIGGGGVGTGDLKAYKRTAANTWSAVSAKFYDGTVGGTPGAAATTFSQQAYAGMYMSSATVGVLVTWRSTDAANDTKKITAWTTADGFSTATPVDIRTHTANGGGTSLQAHLTSGGRLWLMWCDPDNNDKPRFAYTDDIGATWTDIGTPAIVSSEMTLIGLSAIDPTYDVGFTLDANDNLVLFTSTGNVISPGYHLAFRSIVATDANNWALATTCSYVSADNTLSTIAAGQGIVINGQLHRVTTLVRSSGGNHYTLEFIDLEGAGIPEEPGEPASPAAALLSGANENDMLFRVNLAEGGGPSKHTIPVACFMTWDEGDAETGREVPVILKGSASMDPNTQDPSLIPALERIETGRDMGLGRRVYVDASTDQQVTRLDPMRVVVKSKEYTIEGEFSKNLVRGFLCTYTRHGENPLPLSVWVDGRINRLIQMPTTYGLQQVRFFPLPTFANVGTRVQFMVDVEDNDDFSIDAWGVVYMRKRIRG